MDQPNLPVVHDLAIEKEDVCQWTRKDAFRHLYANWYSLRLPIPALTLLSLQP